MFVSTTNEVPRFCTRWLQRGTLGLGCRFFLLAATLFGCGSDEKTDDPRVVEGPCQVEAVAAPDYLKELRCQADFDALASEPLDSKIPGARSTKLLLDMKDASATDALYFQNSGKYKIHYDFASKFLSGMGPLGQPLPPINRDAFNRDEYYGNTRRFLLAAVTYYEGPKIWALEIAPYDSMSPLSVERLYKAVQASTWFGPALSFHPTSEAVQAVAKSLPASVRQKSTDEIFAQTEFQPLNLGEVKGRLRFIKAAELASKFVDFQDIVVLDHVPNDISVTLGIITEEFQTPLSHINVLAQNRKTPNMGLRTALSNPKLLQNEGKWVKFTVGAFDWDVVEIDKAEADAWWEQRKPKPIQLNPLNTSVTDLRDIEDLVVDDNPANLRALIDEAVLAFGTKASNYSVLANTDGVPVRKAFAIPVFYYDQFMRENAFYDEVTALIARPDFAESPEVRFAELQKLRDRIALAPVNGEFQELLRTKLETDYPGLTMRFRTSTNAEDLDGFPCAGCYDSQTGDPKNWDADLLTAVRKAWAGVWFFRTFEERRYNGIDHTAVGMSLLVHHNFPAEEANGVALTANPFEPSGLEPGFYVNVQRGGEAEVVAPPEGVTSDEFIYYWGQRQAQEYLAHSSFVKPGEHVLTEPQILELGLALEAIHERFRSAYAPPAGGWYALEVDFKFDDEDSLDGKAHLLVKQARPHPGRNQ